MYEGPRRLHLWINTSLILRGLLSTKSPVKQVAMPADLTLLRNTLFQPDYLSIFADCRSHLQFTLFLFLVVDYSGRAGELIASSNKKTDNNKHLKWPQLSCLLSLHLLGLQSKPISPLVI
jgi:hypothetical protein